MKKYDKNKKSETLLKAVKLKLDETNKSVFS